MRLRAPAAAVLALAAAVAVTCVSVSAWVAHSRRVGSLVGRGRARPAPLPPQPQRWAGPVTFLRADRLGRTAWKKSWLGQLESAPRACSARGGDSAVAAFVEGRLRQAAAATVAQRAWVKEVRERRVVSVQRLTKYGDGVPGATPKWLLTFTGGVRGIWKAAALKRARFRDASSAPVVDAVVAHRRSSDRQQPLWVVHRDAIADTAATMLLMLANDTRSLPHLLYFMPWHTLNLTWPVDTLRAPLLVGGTLTPFISGLDATDRAPQTPRCELERALDTSQRHRVPSDAGPVYDLRTVDFVTNTVDRDGTNWGAVYPAGMDGTARRQRQRLGRRGRQPPAPTRVVFMDFDSAITGADNTNSRKLAAAMLTGCCTFHTGVLRLLRTAQAALCPDGETPRPPLAAILRAALHRFVAADGISATTPPVTWDVRGGNLTWHAVDARAQLLLRMYKRCSNATLL